MRGPAVPSIASTQFGLFTRSQAYAEGWSERQIRRRLAATRWQVAAGRALAADGLMIGPWQLAQAVHLTWSQAVISHQLAGVLWGFPLPEPDVGTAILLADRHVQARRLSAVRRRVLPGQISSLRGLPVTDEPRTAMDLLAELPWTQARDLFAWLSTRGRINRTELALWTDTRSATAGTGQLRRLLRVSATGSLSAAEDRFHDLLRRAGVTGWQANARIRVAGRVVAVVDVLFATERVVVEVDGWSTHSGRGAFQRDRATQNALVTAGYVVLRFTWSDLVDRPEHVVHTVRQALARGSRSVVTR